MWCWQMLSVFWRIKNYFIFVYNYYSNILTENLQFVSLICGLVVDMCSITICSCWGLMKQKVCCLCSQLFQNYFQPFHYRSNKCYWLVVNRVPRLSNSVRWRQRASCYTRQVEFELIAWINKQTHQRLAIIITTTLMYLLTSLRRVKRRRVDINSDDLVENIILIWQFVSLWSSYTKV